MQFEYSQTVIDLIASMADDPDVLPYGCVDVVDGIAVDMYPTTCPSPRIAEKLAADLNRTAPAGHTFVATGF